MVRTGWKFLDFQNGKIVSRHGDVAWTPGKWHRAKGRICPCVNGFHASETIADAGTWVRGEVLAYVEARGETIVDATKFASRDMRIAKAWRLSPVLSVRIGVALAEHVLDVFEVAYPADARPREAIAAAKAWLEDGSRSNAAKAIDAAAAASISAAKATNAGKWGAASAAGTARSAADTAYAATSAPLGRRWIGGNAAYAAAAARNAVADVTSVQQVIEDILSREEVITW